MTKRPKNPDREQVYAHWTSRPSDQRKAANALKFTDEMWAAGIRLASNQHHHYQHVMDVIRSKIED